MLPAYTTNLPFRVVNWKRLFIFNIVPERSRKMPEKRKSVSGRQRGKKIVRHNQDTDFLVPKKEKGSFSSSKSCKKNQKFCLNGGFKMCKIAK